MHTLDTLYKDMDNLIPEWREPFPQPQTIPSGWDMSEFLSASASASNDNSAVISED